MSAAPFQHDVPPLLADRRRQGQPDEPLNVIQGADRIARVAHDLQYRARDRVQAIVKPPFAAVGALDAVERVQLRNGVDYHVIYDRAALTAGDQLRRATTMVEHGEVARIGSGLPIKLVIADGEVGLIPLTTAGNTVRHAVLLRGSALLGALGQIFDDLWRAATPFGSAAPEPALAPTDQERMVLSLLASGATDETIGRMMGASPRTAHRRVKELMARLGAQTRFQAGMRAVRLGWL